MPFKHHTQEFKNDAIMYWNINFDAPKKDRMTQKECVELIGTILGQSVSSRSIIGWINERHYKEGKKGVTRGGYGVKNIQVVDDELKEFIDDLLISEYNLKKENQRLKEIVEWHIHVLEI